MRIVGVAAVLVLAAVLSGCATNQTEALDRPLAPPPIAIDPGRPCVQAPAPAIAATLGLLAPVGRVTVDPASGAVDLVAGVVDLPTLARLAPDALKQEPVNGFVLRKPLRVLPGASLQVVDTRLSLASGPSLETVSLIAFGGSLEVTRSCVTSWDEARRRTDDDPADGRAFLAAERDGRLTIHDAELHDLGFSAVGSYGLAWRGPNVSGEITHSLVTGLYIGLYIDRAVSIEVRDNEFASNIVYGIDPHTGSRDLTITGNRVHDNGKHGIVLSDNCVRNQVHGNLVYRNGHHGIVLHDHSDRNAVEGNEVFDNGVTGININASSDAIVRGNRIFRNRNEGVVVTELSARTVVASNTIAENGGDGLRLVGDSMGAAVRDNVLTGNKRTGILVHDALATVTGNVVSGHRTGLKARASVSVGANDVHDNAADVLPAP